MQDNSRMTRPQSVLGWIGWVFWNRVEYRLRLAWRLAGFFIIFVFLMVALGMIQGLVLVLIGRVTPDDLMSSPAALQGGISGPVVMTIVTLITMLVAAWAFDRRRFRDFGFRLSKRWWQDLGFGLLLGAVIMLVIFLVEWGLGWIEVMPVWNSADMMQRLWPSLGSGLLLFLSVGFYEEAISRGYLLKNFAEGFTTRWWKPQIAVLLAALLTSVAFGFAHASNPNATIMSSVLISVAGLMLAAGYVLTGELAIPIGIHITWNFFQGYIFGFPVSGLDVGASVFSIRQGGPELWTGGRFGPEAGLIGLTAMLALTASIWAYVRARDGRSGLLAAVAEPELRHRKSVEMEELNGADLVDAVQLSQVDPPQQDPQA